METVLLDRIGRRRSPATMPGYHAGRPPRNKGQRYPADPPTVEEIIRVMRTAGDGPAADRLRGLIVVLWRAGLRISEALALAESDLDRGRGAILVRRGKGGKRREVGMDNWGWEQLDPWLQVREQMPVGALFCIIYGPTRGRPWTKTPSAYSYGAPPPKPAVQPSLRATPAAPRPRCRDGPRRRPAHVIQRQLGHANLGITSSTSKASTTPRSSTPSTTGPHP